MPRPQEGAPPHSVRGARLKPLRAARSALATRTTKEWAGWMPALLVAWRDVARRMARERRLLARGLRRQAWDRVRVAFRDWLRCHERARRREVEQRIQRQAEARTAAERRALDAVEAAEREGRSAAPLRRIALRYQRRWRQGHADVVGAREEACRLASVERRAEKAERRLASLQVLLQHGLALPSPDMPALLTVTNARMAATSTQASRLCADAEDEQETLDDPRSFWAQEEESLLEALDSDQPLSAVEEESIYKRLAQIETLRQRHKVELAAFQERQKARIAARSAQKLADEWQDLWTTMAGRMQEQGRVLRAAALLSGARLPDASGDAGDQLWSELESSERRAAEALGWGKETWDAGRPAEACSHSWAELAVEQQICAALLGWNESKWEKLAGRKRAAVPTTLPEEAEPPLVLTPTGSDAMREQRQHASDPSEARRSTNGSGSADDLDPSATLAGRLRFVSLSAEPTGSDLVALFDAHESQHLQALVTAEFTNLYAAWLGDAVRGHALAFLSPLLISGADLVLRSCALLAVYGAQVEQKAAAVAVCTDGHGALGAECAATLRFFERLLQAAVDLLDEVVLMDETEPTRSDVLEGYVHCYHAWFAERIRVLCDRRATADGRGREKSAGGQHSAAPFAEEMRTTLALLRWVNQYEVQLAHYGVRDLSPSLTSITADTIRKFAADSETHMRTMLKRILKNAHADTPAAVGAAISPLPGASATSADGSEHADSSQLCRSSVPRDLFAMLWEHLQCCETTGNGQLLLSTVQVAVRVVNRWTAAECSGLSTERPLKAVCSVANNMEACMQHASELIKHVQGVLAKTDLLVSSNGNNSTLGALQATFDDAYRVALQTLRDMVLEDISPLLREAQTMKTWCGSDGMNAVLATTEDFFNDFEPKLLAAPYRALSVEVLDALLADYVKALLLGFRHNAAIVKANAALEARQQEDALSSLVGQAPMPLDPNWKDMLLEQFQQDLTSVKTFFREFVSDAAMRNSVGAVESLPMLLECEPVDFATLVREAAERSAQFSAKLVEQVLEARHAGGASAGRLMSECSRVIEQAHATASGGTSVAMMAAANVVEAYDKFWVQLRKTERVAAVSLGWDAMSWDQGLAVEVCSSLWSSLGPRQKEAASTLGYTSESWDRNRNAGSVSTRSTIPTVALSSADEAPAAMSQAGRVALMSAVRRIATFEGSDRFDSLSLRDIRLQLPAALSAVTTSAADARAVDEDRVLQHVIAGGGEGDTELRRVIKAVQEAAATVLTRGNIGGTRYRCCNQVGVTASLEYDPSNPELVCVKEVGDEIVASASGITAAGQVRVQCKLGWISLKSTNGELMLTPLGR